jgi:hypothetical protein
MILLHQGDLSVWLVCHGRHGGGGYRAEFASEVSARTFYQDAAREFPEDDVRLWASVDTTTDRKVETA